MTNEMRPTEAILRALKAKRKRAYKPPKPAPAQWIDESGNKHDVHYTIVKNRKPACDLAGMSNDPGRKHTATTPNKKGVTCRPCLLWIHAHD